MTKVPKRKSFETNLRKFRSNWAKVFVKKFPKIWVYRSRLPTFQNFEKTLGAFYSTKNQEKFETGTNDIENAWENSKIKNSETVKFRK